MHKNLYPAPMTEQWYREKFSGTDAVFGPHSVCLRTPDGVAECRYVDHIDVDYIESLIWVSPEVADLYDKRKIAQYIYENIDLNAVSFTRFIAFVGRQSDLEPLEKQGIVSDGDITMFTIAGAYAFCAFRQKKIVFYCPNIKSNQHLTDCIVHEFRHMIMCASEDGIADPALYRKGQASERDVISYAAKICKELPAIALL